MIAAFRDSGVEGTERTAITRPFLVIKTGSVAARRRYLPKRSFNSVAGIFIGLPPLRLYLILFPFYISSHLKFKERREFSKQRARKKRREASSFVSLMIRTPRGNSSFCPDGQSRIYHRGHLFSR
jgi:hypothetical protein